MAQSFYSSPLPSNHITHSVLPHPPYCSFPFYFTPLPQLPLNHLPPCPQDEMLEEVFTPLLSRDDVASDYKVALITEYIRSLRLHKLRISYYFYEIVVGLLIRCNQLFRLHQLVQFQVLGDSAPLACLLLSLEKSYAPGQSYSGFLNVMYRILLYAFTYYCI